MDSNNYTKALVEINKLINEDNLDDAEKILSQYLNEYKECSSKDRMLHSFANLLLQRGRYLSFVLDESMVDKYYNIASKKYVNLLLYKYTKGTRDTNAKLIEYKIGIVRCLEGLGRYSDSHAQHKNILQDEPLYDESIAKLCWLNKNFNKLNNFAKDISDVDLQIEIYAATAKFLCHEKLFYEAKNWLETPCKKFPENLLLHLALAKVLLLCGKEEKRAKASERLYNEAVKVLDSYCEINVSGKSHPLLKLALANAYITFAQSLVEEKALLAKEYASKAVSILGGIKNPPWCLFQRCNEVIVICDKKLSEAVEEDLLIDDNLHIVESLLEEECELKIDSITISLTCNP